MKITRRNALQFGAGASLAALGGRAVAQDAGALTLGCIIPLSGPQESLGRMLRLGGEIAVEQINAAGGVLGRKLAIEFRDDRGSANTGVAAYRELYGGGIRFFIPMSTTVVLAMHPLVPQDNAVSIAACTITDVVNHELYNRNCFRITDSPYMRYHAQARLLAQRNADVQVWATPLTDAAFATAIWAAFSSGLRKWYPREAHREPKILDPILTRPGQTDFKNQIAALLATDVQGIFLGLQGQDLLTFMSQAHAMGLDRKIKIAADPGGDVILGRALGRNLTLDIWSPSHWYYGNYQDIAPGKALYDAYVARTGDKIPNGFLEPIHAAAYAFARAITAAGSTEIPAVIAAVEALRWESAKGPRSFRKEDHQVINNVDLIRLAPASTEAGWQVAEAMKLPGVDVIEPARPGEKIDYNS